jgi:serine/threonine-protein kinase
VRDLDALESRPLAGTLAGRAPFISPDGRWVGFVAGEEVRKVAISGGSAVSICRLPRAATAAWGDDGFIVAASVDGVLHRVSSEGGEPKTLLADPEREEQYHHPLVLPGSSWVLFTVRTGGDMEDARVDALHLTSGERKTVVRGGYDPAYVDSGHLVYTVAQLTASSDVSFHASLRAVRFDAGRADVSGESVSMVTPLTVVRAGPADYSVSRSGDLIFVPAGTVRQPARTLVWVDRKGREEPIPAEPRTYEVARISPDGARIVLDLRDQTNDMWIWDITRRTLTPLNRDPGQDMSPLWTADGKRIIWTSSRGGGFPNLFWQAADGSGTAERLTTHPTVQFPISITPDGGTVLGFTSTTGRRQIFRVSIAARDQKAVPLLSGRSVEYGPEISPDGKWLAYHSDESGEFQVYVRPFPNVESGRIQVSTTGGSRAAWSRTGNELFYLDQDGMLTGVAVKTTGESFAAGVPAKILNTRYHGGVTLGGYDLRAFDVSPDGQRFLMIKDVDSIKPSPESETSMVLVMDWVEELKARVPAR